MAITDMLGKIDKMSDLYAGNPNKLKQRAQQAAKGLGMGKVAAPTLEALALQKVKSEKEAAMRDMQMQLEQSPKNLAQRLEEEAVGITQQELAQNVGEVNRLKKLRQDKGIKQAAKKAMPQGGLGSFLAQNKPQQRPPQQRPPQQRPPQQIRQAAQGGLMRFDKGGLAETDLKEFVASGQAGLDKAKIQRMIDDPNVSTEQILAIYGSKVQAYKDMKAGRTKTEEKLKTKFDADMAENRRRAALSPAQRDVEDLTKDKSTATVAPEAEAASSKVETKPFVPPEEPLVLRKPEAKPEEQGIATPTYATPDGKAPPPAKQPPTYEERLAEVTGGTITPTTQNKEDTEGLLKKSGMMDAQGNFVATPESVATAGKKGATDAENLIGRDNVATQYGLLQGDYQELYDKRKKEMEEIYSPEALKKAQRSAYFGDIISGRGTLGPAQKAAEAVRKQQRDDAKTRYDSLEELAKGKVDLGERALQADVAIGTAALNASNIAKQVAQQTISTSVKALSEATMADKKQAVEVAKLATENAKLEIEKLTEMQKVQTDSAESAREQLTKIMELKGSLAEKVLKGIDEKEKVQGLEPMSAEDKAILVGNTVTKMLAEANMLDYIAALEKQAGGIDEIRKQKATDAEYNAAMAKYGNSALPGGINSPTFNPLTPPAR
jgi:hypothetical protein